MKRLFTSLSFVVILLLCVAFKPTLLPSDTVSFICTYKLSHQPDSLSQEKKSELMRLTVTPSFSSFESQYAYLRDSTLASPSFSQASMEALGTYLKTSFRYKIYKTYASKTINHYDIIGQKTYDIKQQHTPIAWKISNESRTIANYACRKATASYGGRQWVAWFTTEVPVSDGPYKFMGLPGLITELTDTRGHYHFTLIRLAKAPAATKASFPVNAIATTRAEYTTGKATNDLQKVSEIYRKNSPQTAQQDIQNYKQKQARKNNPLELK